MLSERVVFVQDHPAAEAVQQFVQSTHLTCYSSLSSVPASTEFVLLSTANGLSLESRANKITLFVDFVAGAQAHRRKFGGGKKQLIAKAVGINKNKGVTVLDLTAGLGKDAFVLASLGCDVTLVEKHPLIFLLLEDGFNRARHDTSDETLIPILSRMRLLHTDGIAFLETVKELAQQVIFLDPMFPQREKSAAVKKDMMLLQSLLEEDGGEGDDGGLLFQTAIASQPHRIVVKRPKRALSLTNHQPNLQFKGKSGRFDVYTYKKLFSK